MSALLTFVFIATFVGVWLVLGYLHRKAILDHPTERSSHVAPTPRGGGLIVSLVILFAWLYWEPTWEMAIVCSGGFGLAALSWIDDVNGGLGPQWRLLGHIAAVSAVLWFDGHETLYFAGLLPPTVDGFVAGLAWVWFINLFNFMDGVDGISGVETIAIGLGAALVSIAMNPGAVRIGLGLVLAVALFAFLLWNWHPAKIFLGDVGSVPLGFLLGWLLLDLARDGLWAVALILPLYYLVDATYTLLRRALHWEKVWRPHKQHCYQQAVAKGMRHDTVVAMIALANGVLVLLALNTVEHGVVAPLIMAVAVVGILCILLAKGIGRKR